MIFFNLWALRALSAPRVAATAYCDPGRHANVITPCLLTPCLKVPNNILSWGSEQNKSILFYPVNRLLVPGFALSWEIMGEYPLTATWRVQ